MDKYALKIVTLGTLLFIFSMLFITCLRISQLSGNSMYPTLINNEITLSLRQFFPENLTDRVVSFQYNSTITVCHRVIADNGTHILTKGDNNCCPDGWYSKDTLISWVVWHSLQGIPWQ